MRLSLRHHVTLAVCPAVLGLAACDDPLTPVKRESPPGLTPTVPNFAIVSGAMPVELPNLGGVDGYAYGINDNGYVVGIAYTSDPSVRRAVRWSPEGVVTDLPGLPDNAVAVDINLNGQIAGYTPDGRAFVWSASKGVQYLPTLGGISLAARINNNGQVVGESEVAPDIYHAFLWTPDGAGGGVMHDLGTLENGCAEPRANQSSAYDVNDRGEVVGMSLRCTGYQRAFIWSADKGMREIPTLDRGNRAYARGINNSGQVTGYSNVNGEYSPNHAFIWTESAGIRDLGTPSGWTESYGYDINDKGEVTGFGVFGTSRTIVWTEDGGMMELGGLLADWESHGNAINAKGQVAGQSRATSPTGWRAVRWDIEYQDRAPVANAGGPYSASEGSALLVTGTAADEDGDPLSFSWAFGDGGTASSASASHAYADNGSFTATFTATDPKGLSGSSTASVTISNVAPSVTLGGPATIYSGDTYNLSAPFSDPGTLDAPWRTSISWGDGLFQEGSRSDQSSPITGAHQYFRAGTYTIRVTATDKDGGQGEASMTLEVARFPTKIDADSRTETNAISMQKGAPNLSVLLFTTAAYDARVANPGSMVITNGAGSGTRLRATRQGLDYDYVDVNRDGRVDLVLSFSKSEMIANGDLTLATRKLILLGDGSDRRQTRGEDLVTVTP